MTSRTKKYGSRLLKGGFEERQELGFQRRTIRRITKEELELEKLKKQVTDKKRQVTDKTTEIKELKKTLFEINKRIGDFDLTKNKHKINVVIVHNKTRRRGKVYFYRKWRYFHICMNDKYDESKIDEYKDLVRDKFIKSLQS